MRYCRSKCEQMEEELTYKVFVTDCLSVLTNTDARYYDVINEEEIIETRTGDEIKETIKDKLKRMAEG